MLSLRVYGRFNNGIVGVRPKRHFLILCDVVIIQNLTAVKNRNTIIFVFQLAAFLSA